MNKFICATVALLLCHAADATKLPVEDFSRSAEFSQLRLSPNGQWVAALVSRNNRRNIAVLDVDERRAIPITDQRDANVSDFFWANDDRIVYLIDSNGNESYGISAVDRDGSNSRVLVRPRNAVEIFPTQVLPLDRLRLDPDHILVTSNERRKLYPDVYRLHIDSGRMTRIVANPGYVRQWLTDRDGTVRIGIGDTEDPRTLITRIVYRADADSQWEVLEEFHQFDDHSWMPLGIAPGGDALFVSSNIGRDTAAIMQYDLIERRLGDLFFADDEADIDEIELSPADGRLLSVRYDREKPLEHAIDEEFRAVTRSVDRALADTVNRLVSISDDESRMIFLSFSDTHPGSYFFLDRSANRLEFFADTRSWLEPGDMAPMTPIRFEARDGLELHGYLTLPVEGATERVPLIVRPHGGPFNVRDTWGFDPETQFLANRGYAVLQINFRGSGGYGKALVDRGWRQWGAAMQDDLTDAVQWAIDHHIADRDRICIYGASYGGYAAMAGVTLTPELYQCAINYVGIADLIELYRSMTRSRLGGDTLEAWFTRAIGDPRTQRGHIESISPINLLESVRAPILVIHGKRDPRVPVRQAELLSRALRSFEIPHDTLIKVDEGHGFVNEENRLELYRLVERFLSEHL